MFETFETKVREKLIEDLLWLEGELAAQTPSLAQAGHVGEGGLFLVGSHLTAADIMMGFSVKLILEVILKPTQTAQDIKNQKSEEKEASKSYPYIEKWLANLQNREAWKRAYKRTALPG